MKTNLSNIEKSKKMELERAEKAELEVNFLKSQKEILKSKTLKKLALSNIMPLRKKKKFSSVWCWKFLQD